MLIVLIAIFLFSQLQNVVPVTVSMKGFLSKTFLKSMRVEIPKVVSKISSIATSLLSVQSLLSFLLTEDTCHGVVLYVH